MNNYDLLLRDNWDAASVLIITPYVTRGFFETLLKEVKPKDLYILVDDGCREEDLLMLDSLGRRGTRIFIAQGAASGGLVHAKVYHTIWQNRLATQNRHTLLIGSGNATEPAFGYGNSKEPTFSSSKNAEVFARIDISKSPDSSDLKAKFAEMRQAVEAAAMESEHFKVGSVTKLWVAEGVHLRWPAIKVKPRRNIADSFDAWLQRGWLLSNYVPDADFLKVAVRLKKALPPSAIEASVNQADWETNKSQVIRHSYLGMDIEQNDAEQTDTAKPDSEKWRAKYFVQTHLGFWCSSACFEKRKDEFVKGGKDNRKAYLELLGKLEDRSALASARGRFIRKLEDLWQALGVDAPQYLNANKNCLDHSYYTELFDKKIKQDLKKRKNSEFSERFIFGVQRAKLPKFRDDKEGWDDFLTSFASQLQYENGKEKSQNLIFQHVKMCIDFEADNVCSKLQSRWEKKVKGKSCSTGEFVDRYHEQAETSS